MLTCSIYKYLLYHNEESNLFSSSEGYSRPNIDLRAYFGGFFTVKSSLSISQTKQGTPTIYKNEIVQIYNDIILMRICNEKRVSVVTNYQERKEISNPWCYVIIDNRPNRGYIIIEKSSSFYSDTDTVRDLLRNAFHQMMFKPEHHLDITIEINAKLNEGDFWKMVNDRRFKYKDEISKVTFDFPNPQKVAMIDAPAQMLGNLAILLSITGAANGIKGSYSISAATNTSLELQKTINNVQTDLANMVELCTRNTYELTVTFKNYGEFKYSRAAGQCKEMINLNEEYVNQFTFDPKELLAEKSGYKLIDWLDEQEEHVKELKDEKPVLN